MISTLRGTVSFAASDAVIIDVGGVGFSVAVPAQLAGSVIVGTETLLHTTLVVREDALSLYGFAEREELVVFSQLIGVTGVGPKSALGVLSSLTVPQIVDAVAADDDAPFRRVSGIGPKTAKLIVVQLAGKLAASTAPGTPITTVPGVGAQVAAALVGLGWAERTASEAVAQVNESATDTDRASVAALLKLTLSHLGPATKERSG